MSEIYEVNSLDELLRLNRGDLVKVRQVPLEGVNFYWDEILAFACVVFPRRFLDQRLCIEFLDLCQNDGHRRIDSTLYEGRKLKFERGVILTSPVDLVESNSYREGRDPGYDKRISLVESLE